jgi:hypothetical protein
MLAAIEGPINAKTEQIRSEFQALLNKTNKENPRPQDVKALSDLLISEKSLELWRGVASAGYLAELTVIENARATPAVKECWKHRLQKLKKDLGSYGAPLLEHLLIQQAALCWFAAQSCGDQLLVCNETVDKPEPRHLLGKAIVSCAEAFHTCLRNPGAERELSPNTPALQFNRLRAGSRLMSRV